MERWIARVSLLAAFVLAGIVARIGALETGGPQHVHFEIPLDGARDGLPATLYLPAPLGEGARPMRLPNDPPAPDARPPAVALMHGFSSDRRGMSTLARSLAEAGYAVLAFDAGGHGENRNPFGPAQSTTHYFDREWSAAVGWLRRSAYVDGHRVAVMGHSMGAGAALAYATRDSGVEAAVMIAGGTLMPGPHHPRNALFIYAEGDPQRLQRRASALAARLAGVAASEPGSRYGDFAKGTAVGHERVPGTDHLTVVYASTSIERIVAWLDASVGRERATPAGQADPRLGWAGLGLVAWLLVLPGLGRATARIAPAAPAAAGEAGISDLGIWAVGLVVAACLCAPGSPLPLLGLAVADIVIPMLAIAGSLALFAAHALGRIDLAVAWAEARSRGMRFSVATLSVLAAFVVVFGALALVGHTIGLTPERAWAALLGFFVLVPAVLAPQLVLRRGAVVRANAMAAAGRVLAIVAVFAATTLGVLPPVVMLMLPVLALLQLVIEIFAASHHAAGGHRVAAALCEAAILSWVLAAVLPMRL